MIDCLANRVRRIFEIDPVEACAVICARQLDEVIEEGRVLLRPQSIGNMKLVAGMRGIEAGEQRTHGGMQAIRRQCEMERGRHLRCSGSTRSRIGHSEGCRDAFRREEEVPVLLAKLAVQIDSEGVIALSDGGLVRRKRWRCLRHGISLRQVQKRNQQKKPLHGNLDPKGRAPAQRMR